VTAVASGAYSLFPIAALCISPQGPLWCFQAMHDNDQDQSAPNREVIQQQVFLAKDAPAEFLARIKMLAAGDFALNPPRRVVAPAG
jgi:hypothetical protein